MTVFEKQGQGAVGSHPLAEHCQSNQLDLSVSAAKNTWSIDQHREWNNCLTAACMGRCAVNHTASEEPVNHAAPDAPQLIEA